MFCFLQAFRHVDQEGGYKYASQTGKVKGGEHSSSEWYWYTAVQLFKRSLGANESLTLFSLLEMEMKKKGNRELKESRLRLKKTLPMQTPVLVGS